MSRTQQPSNSKLLKRRNFLSRTAAIGGIAALGASAGPVQAARTLTREAPAGAGRDKSIWVGNATVDDFSRLVGKQFRLRTEDGTTTQARLIETSVPKTRRGLRFRREHYSIVFDVPAGVELVQGQYRISHPRIGSMDLFMVPVDLPEKFNRLEAVFT